MCTAISLKCGGHFFGRNLDMEFSYGESVAVIPRRYKLKFLKTDNIYEHFAFIGAAHVADGFPLFYDGVNEKGLGVAALNFPVYCRYFPVKEGKRNLAPFEAIPRVLASCASVKEARALLEGVNIADLHYGAELKNTPLHFILADGTQCIVAESVEDGLKIYDDPAGVLTNSPPFPYMLYSLNEYAGLSRDARRHAFGGGLKLEEYSRGMGGVGLPGDFSSRSRFIKAAFMRANSVCGADPREGVAQLFALLAGVAQPRGCVRLEDGKLEKTVYSCCCDCAGGIYYYKTYSGTCLSAVDMRAENLDGDRPVYYPMEVTNKTVKRN